MIIKKIETVTGKSVIKVKEYIEDYFENDDEE
jgi:hypothetical protein